MRGGRYSWLWPAAAAAAAIAAAPADAATLTVDAGALRARIATAPFALTFTDRAGRTVLGGGALRASPGSDATAASDVRRDGRAVTATLNGAATPLQLRVEPAGEGSIRVRLSAPAAVPGGTLAGSFAAPAGEDFGGFGERSNALDQRGGSVLDTVSDGPTPAGDRGYTHAVIPPWGLQDRDDSTYYPVPWLLSSRGYGVLVENDENSTFDLGASDPSRWSVSVPAATLSLRVFAGPRPADALRRFTAATGRQPYARAPWVYGPWFQTGQPNIVPVAEEGQIIRTQRRADVPVSAMETQMHWLPCGAQRGHEADERRRTAQAHAAGLARLVYFNPALCQSYEPVFDQASAAKVLQKSAGEVFTYPSFVGGSGQFGFTEEPLALFDFTAKGTQAFYARLIRAAYDTGVDGWMEDFGEYSPPAVQAADGTSADRLHNRYTRDYHCTVARIVAALPRPLTRHQRSGWTGAARCASIVWGGDPTTIWGFDGLSSAVTQALTIGESGVARWGSDIGGYVSLGNNEHLTPELLHRWIEFGAVSAVMRTKRTGLAIPSYTRPQVFDHGTLPLWRLFTKLHTQLYPYLRAADAEYRATGMPIMRAGMLTDPGDARAVRAADQFEFGPDLLAAPVTAPGVRRRSVYLPRGDWVDFWASTTFRHRDGAFLPRRARVLAGRHSVVLPAPEDRIPLLVRAGAVLPMLPADVDTLSPYGGRGIVRLADRRGQLTLLAFPRGRWSGRAGDHGRLRSVAGAHSWTLGVSGLGRSTLTVRAALGAVRRPFAPHAVTVRGRGARVLRWRYDRRTRVLTAVVRTRGAANVLVR